MARAVFNRVSIEIPAGWRDQSFVALLGPESVPAPTMTARRAPAARPTLVISRTDSTGAGDLETLADLQAQVMAAAVPGSKLVARGALAIGAGPARIPVVTREYGIDDGVSLTHQLHAYLELGGDVYVVVGSSLVGAGLARAREQFLAMVSSLRCE